MPGMPTGRQALGDNEPALPKEHASPGGSGDTKVIWWPSRCSQAAVEVPMMPVPRTASFIDESVPSGEAAGKYAPMQRNQAMLALPPNGYQSARVARSRTSEFIRLR